MQSIRANRITRKANGEVQVVISPKEKSPCSVAGIIDDDGNLKDVHCENNSCEGTCKLHEDHQDDTVHYYCTCS